MGPENQRHVSVNPLNPHKFVDTVKDLTESLFLLHFSLLACSVTNSIRLRGHILWVKNYSNCSIVLLLSRNYSDSNAGRQIRLCTLRIPATDLHTLLISTEADFEHNFH